MKFSSIFLRGFGLVSLMWGVNLFLYSVLGTSVSPVGVFEKFGYMEQFLFVVMFTVGGYLFYSQLITWKYFRENVLENSESVEE